MSSEFRIDCQWIEPGSGGPAARRFLAEVRIDADGVPVTALADTRTRSYRPGIRVSAYDLAAWFVANWWRLRWEVDGAGTSWEMSHRVGATGNGYLWPDLEFIGGDATVQIRSNPVSLGATSHLRFLSEVNIHVPARDFESAVRDFIEAVTSRLRSLAGQELEGLQELLTAWRDLGREIKDPVLSFDRALEARMGFDPEEAEPALLSSLRQVANEVGRSPVEELAASSKSRALDDFEILWREARDKSCPIRLDVNSAVRTGVAQLENRGLKPWKKGEVLADLARREWSINGDAINNRELAELCGVPEDWIRSGFDENTPIPAGFRNSSEDGGLVASLKKRHPTGRRFALARIVGDHLLAGASDRLLPVTDMATDRQKFQRAFAQAFLCPFEALQSHLGSKVPDDDFIEDAAQHFEVSSWLVRSALINHGVLSPAAISS